MISLKPGIKFLLINCGLLSFILLFNGCTKNALNVKPDATIAVPVTINDYQLLLDGIDGGVISNLIGFVSYRSLGDYLSDYVYMNDVSYNAAYTNNVFINGVLKWDKSMFNGLTTLNEWDKSYKIVLNTNIVAEGINGITPTPATQAAWNNVKGSALFMRGVTFYNLAQLWAQPYSAATANSDQGIVLRTGADVDVPSVRSSVQATYNQIISDLTTAASLLPNTTIQNTQISKVRPSQAAAYGMLARTYLAMGDSVNVFKYANLALQEYAALLDYNSVTVANFSNYPNFNAEIVSYNVDNIGTIASNSGGSWIVDSAFVKSSYAANDLRKNLYFTKVTTNPSINGYLFVGDYSTNYRFNGIAVDELYLMRAEANARLGNTAAAMADLNTLLIKRFKTGTFVPYTATSASDALVQIVNERKKELILRGTRWSDLRRLNSDSRFRKTLTRTVNGTVYTLPPGDSRYTLQIPDYVINAANGSIQQTP